MNNQKVNEGIKRVKNYRLLREIGKGAAGVVYEAIDDNTNKQYAIKSMSLERINRGQDKEQIINSFRQEMKILRKLDQYNVVKFYGVEKTANNIYLVLEYANGGNLFEYLQFYKKTNKAAPSEKICQFLIRQIAKGLEYLHKNKITHRDMKPENILLHFPQITGLVDLSKVNIDEVVIKIADLGYAKELHGDETMQTICGTAPNMAPDVIKNFNQFNSNGIKTYNSTVDLWSLGTILYELAFGVLPFHSNNFNDIFNQIMSGKYKMPKSTKDGKISVELITFLNGLLQFDPNKRMNWDQIKSHPFIANKVRDFHFVELEAINPDKNSLQMELNSKDANNFLWVLLKPKEPNKIKALDKLESKIFDNKTQLNQIAVKEEDNPDDKEVIDERKIENKKQENNNDIKTDKIEKISIIVPNIRSNNDENKGIKDPALEKEEEFEYVDDDWERLSCESFYYIEEESDFVLSEYEKLEIDLKYYV